MQNIKEPKPVPIKITKIGSNKNWLFLYLPKEVIKELQLKKGTRVLILLDKKSHTMVVKPLE